MKPLIARNIRVFEDHLVRLTAQCGRAPDSVSWIAVSKWMAPEKILEAYEAGVRRFGENRVQELAEKVKQLPSDIEWHMIGGLQRNKVRLACESADVIQSVDRPELASRLKDAAGQKPGGKLRCLLQVNTTGELSKGGFAPEELPRFLEGLPGDSGLQIEGLMTIGPLTEDRDAVRRSFRETRLLRDRLARDFPQHGWKVLSMGMSGDYDIAIEEGATLLRVGSLIFGDRPGRRPSE